MKLEINKVITLGNGEKYLIVANVVHNNNEYYYIAELNDDESVMKDNYKIVVSSSNDGKAFIDEVVGEANLKTVLPLFVNNIENN